MYYLQVATLVAINLFLALGAYLPLSTGLMVMCFGALMSVGAVASATAHANLGVPFPVAVLLGGAAAAGAGLVVSMLCSRLTGFLFAVATLGIGELARVIAINSELLGGALGYRDVKMVPYPFYWACLIGTASALLILLSLFERSAARHALAVLRENQSLATSLGISGPRHRLGAVTAGGFLVGLGGGFYIHSVGLLDPRMFGFEHSLLILVFAVLGGVRHFTGPLLGAVALTILPEALRFSPSSRMVLYGTVLVIVAVLRPEGILAVSQKR